MTTRHYEARALERELERHRCPGSVSGHDTTGRRDGRCTWCGRWLERPAPRPNLNSRKGFVNGRWIRVDPHTELGDAYRYHYDPDWGSGPFDI